MHHDQTEGMGRCRGTWTFRLSAEWEPGSTFAGLWREKEGAGEYPLIEPEIVKELDVVLLSHAHEDHSVAIPLLYKMGYQGEVWTTRETREQLHTYFRAWRRNMERAGHALPYEEGDEQLIRYRFLEDEAEGGTWFEIIPGVSVVWGRSGHLAGSVWFGLEMEDKRIFYSGDYTSESMLLQEDCPADVFWQASLPRNRRGLDAPVSPHWISDIRTAVNGGHVMTGEPSASQSLASASSEGVLRSSVLAGWPVEQQLAYSTAKEAEVNKASSIGLLDLVIMDAAYGTDRDTQAHKLDQLEQAIHETITRGEGAHAYALGGSWSGNHAVGTAAVPARSDCSGTRLGGRSEAAFTCSILVKGRGRTHTGACEGCDWAFSEWSRMGAAFDK